MQMEVAIFPPHFAARMLASSSPGPPVAALSGELDAAAADLFAAALRAIVPAGQPLILDVDRLSFLDSSGLRVLLELRRHAGDTPASLTLNRRSPGVARVLELLGVHDHFADGNTAYPPDHPSHPILPVA